jgi:PAS domain S-box-containing protein
VHPDDRAAVDAAYSGSLRESRDSYEIEHRVVRKDTGEVRHIHEKCEHFRNVDGQIVRSVGMVHDITERKQAEEALKQSERRFRALTEKASEFITILDEKGKITYNMAGSNNSLGYTAGDMVGSSGFELVHPEDLPRVLELFQQSASQPGRIEHAEVRVRAKTVRGGGSPRWAPTCSTTPRWEASSSTASTSLNASKLRRPCGS